MCLPHHLLEYLPLMGYNYPIIYKKGVMYYVYILFNHSNTVNYTGVTNDLERRLSEHKTHENPKSFTAQFNVSKLVHYETFESPKTAIEREKQIKSWSRWKKLWLVSNENPEFKDISLDWEV